MAWQACVLCKKQRRRCSPDCIFAPYFPPSRKMQFHNVHKLFGVHNLTKMITDLDQSQRDEAMKCIIYEANMRALDPVGGCCAIVRHLSHSILENQTQLNRIRHQLAKISEEPQFFHLLQQDVNIAQTTHNNSVSLSSLHQEVPHQEQPFDINDHLQEEGLNSCAAQDSLSLSLSLSSSTHVNHGAGHQERSVDIRFVPSTHAVVHIGDILSPS
ncbi:hypothetical protein SLA2020_494270 [Shorea laevis]